MVVRLALPTTEESDRSADPPSFEVIDENTPAGDGFLHTTIVLRSGGRKSSLTIRTTGPADLGTLESLLRATQ